MIRKSPNFIPFLIAVIVSIAIAAVAYLVFPYCGDLPANCHHADNRIMTLLNFLESHDAAFNAITSILTLILTGALVLATIRIYKHSAASERAYIKMSHASPGVDFDGVKPAVRISIEVKNFGRTPARLLDTIFKYKILPSGISLPEQPDYSGGQCAKLATAFLVTDDYFYHHLKTSPLTPAQLRELRAGRMSLYVYGYVDYVDTFGKRHRSGYGRVYDPKKDIRLANLTDEQYANRNNLVYFTLPEYNYDRPIK
jgi:hypothetical protein